MIKPWCIRWLPLLLAAICSAGALDTAAAQSALPGVPLVAPAATTPDAPEAVSRWSQHALERIGEIRASLDTTATVAAQVDAFAAASEKFDTQFKRFSGSPQRLADLSDTALEDATRELNTIAASVKLIDKVLEGRAVSLEMQLRELAVLRERAMELYKDGAAGVLPEALTARLDRIVSEIGVLTAAVRDRLNQAAGLQNRILTLNERIAAARGAIARVKSTRLRELLQFERTPLWNVTGEEFATSARNSTEFALHNLPGTLRDFARDQYPRIALHLMVLVLILWLVLVLRRSYRVDEAAKVRSRAFERPISASVLIALLATPLLYPDASIALRSLSGAVLLVPMLRMLTLYVDRSLWKQLFAITGLAIVERLMSALSLEVLIQRLALLVLSAATIAVLVWSLFARAERGFALALSNQRYVRGLLLGGLWLSAASAIFNILGNVSLAAVLQGGVVKAVLVAAGMLAAVRVLDEMAYLVGEALERRGVRSVMRHRSELDRRVKRINALIGFAVWLYYVTLVFRIDGPLLAALSGILAATWTIGTISLSLGRMVAFVLAVWIAIRASRITQIVLNEDVLPKFLLPRGVPNAIAVIVNYTMVVIGLLIGAGFLGIGLSNLALIVGALGVGIGFGLQNIVSNFVSGLILLFERPVQVGDSVQLGTVAGRVSYIGYRSSHIRTYSGSEVVVPNAELLSTQLVNWTLSDRRRRLELTVGVAYGTDPERVETALYEVLKADPEVLLEPAPFVLFEAFGDSALQFRVYAWIADFDESPKVLHRLNVSIARALAAAAITIPFPQRDVHIRT